MIFDSLGVSRITNVLPFCHKWRSALTGKSQKSELCTFSLCTLIIASLYGLSNICVCVRACVFRNTAYAFTPLPSVSKASAFHIYRNVHNISTLRLRWYTRNARPPSEEYSVSVILYIDCFHILPRGNRIIYSYKSTASVTHHITLCSFQSTTNTRRRDNIRRPNLPFRGTDKQTLCGCHTNIFFSGLTPVLMYSSNGQLP